MANNWKYGGGRTVKMKDNISYTFNNTTTAYASSLLGDDRYPGTQEFPKATANAAIALSKGQVVLTGRFNNETVTSSQNFFADGNCLLASTSPSGNVFQAIGKTSYDFNVQGMVWSSGAYNHRFMNAVTKITNLIFIGGKDCYIIYNESNTPNPSITIRNRADINSTVVLKTPITINFGDSSPARSTNCILVIKEDLIFDLSGYLGTAFSDNSILVIEANIKVIGGGLGNDETTFTPVTSLTQLRQRFVNVRGGSVDDYFPKIIALNPNCFADPSNDDYRIDISKPDWQIAGFGGEGYTHIGAFKPALIISPTTDFSETYNLDVTDNKFSLLSRLENAYAISYIKNIGGSRKKLGRVLPNLVEALLDGIILDNSPTLGSIENPTGTTFSVEEGKSYVVWSGNGVTCDGLVFTVGQSFTVPTGITTATDDDGSGSVRENLNPINRRVVSLRYSDENTYTTNITTQDNNRWIYVNSGSISDGTTTYAAGEYLLYNSALTYTGTYSLLGLFLESDNWLEIEPSFHTDATIDNSDIGNASPTYNFDEINSIYFKHIQIRIDVLVDGNPYHI